MVKQKSADVLVTSGVKRKQTPEAETTLATDPLDSVRILVVSNPQMPLESGLWRFGLTCW